MADKDKILTLFTTRVRQMILQYNALKEENNELYALVDSHEEEIKRLNASLEQARKDYESLKAAKMMEICDGDIESAKRRLAALIREVNKCITLLSGK
jgi:predicted  nucleic acid-binding Zn-ribbon protein